MRVMCWTVIFPDCAAYVYVKIKQHLLIIYCHVQVDFRCTDSQNLT